jgi:hypothetical protein
MSRAVYLNLSEKAVVAHCTAENIGISSIETVATGGTRLVCMSVSGAAEVRRKLKTNLTKADVAQERRGPGQGFNPRP